MLKKLFLIAVIALLSHSAYSQSFEDLSPFGEFLAAQPTEYVEHSVRYDADLTVSYRLFNGIPWSGYYINTADNSIVNLNYANVLEASINRSLPIFHPQVNYERSLLKIHNAATASDKDFHVVILDVLTGKSVYSDIVKPNVSTAGAYTVSNEADGDGAVVDYSFLPNGAYFVMLINDKNEIFTTALLEKPKRNLTD